MACIICFYLGSSHLFKAQLKPQPEPAISTGRSAGLQEMNPSGSPKREARGRTQLACGRSWRSESKIAAGCTEMVKGTGSRQHRCSREYTWIRLERGISITLTINRFIWARGSLGLFGQNHESPLNEADPGCVQPSRRISLDHNRGLVGGE